MRVRTPDGPDGSDGRHIQGIVTVSVMHDRGGRPQRLVGQLEDVTELRRLEQQLIQAEKLKSIGQLAAGVAHEINTPTQFVGHNLEFLREALAELLAAAPTSPSFTSGRSENALADLLEEIPRAIEESIDGIERVAAIVGSIRELAHPGSSAREPIDLNQAIEAAVLLTTSRWKRAAEIELDLAPDLPPLVCLPGAINQVLVNLIVNAANGDYLGNRPIQ